MKKRALVAEEKGERQLLNERGVCQGKEVRAKAPLKERMNGEKENSEKCLKQP
jgi:hypothetical protein